MLGRSSRTLGECDICKTISSRFIDACNQIAYCRIELTMLSVPTMGLGIFVIYCCLETISELQLTRKIRPLHCYHSESRAPLAVKYDISHRR
jgi:hypothetical protein